MIRLKILLPTLAVLCSSAMAQTRTFIVPPSARTIPGNSLDQEPFGLDRIKYAQFVDKGYLPGLATGSRIKEIRYRREENRLDKVFRNYEPMRRGTAVIPRWQIRMGNFSGRYDRLVPQYANRANATVWTTVFAGKLNYSVNTPTLPPPANPKIPAPFAMRFPFNIASVTYGGRGLAVEHFTYASRNRVHIYFIDSIISQPSNGGTVDLIDAKSVGCPKNFNRVHGTAPNPGGGAVQLHLFGAPANRPAIAYFGASASTWNGAMLPLNMGFMNMAACNIYTGLTFPVFAKTDIAGISSLVIPVPATSSFTGAVIYNQWAIADPRVNPALGFAMSDGVKITIGSRVGNDTVLMSVISGEGNRANSRSGFLQPNRGAIFQLVY